MALSLVGLAHIVRRLVEGSLPPLLPARFAAHPQLPETTASGIRLPGRGTQAGHPPDQDPAKSQLVTIRAEIGTVLDHRYRHPMAIPSKIKSTRGSAAGCEAVVPSWRPSPNVTCPAR